MDPVSALGIAAAVVQFLEVGTKVTKRLVEYINASPGDIPRTISDIVIQLPLITKSLGTIKEEGSIKNYDNDIRLILHGVVLGCLKLAEELDHIAAKISPKPGESLNAKLKKVLSSLKNENRVSEIERGLQAYVQILILHQVVNPTDVSVGPPVDVTYYEVKEVRVQNAQPRQGYITKLHEAFRQASRTQLANPEFVVLFGKQGAGKTQLALEYCQDAYNAGHFRAIFWLDASDPTTLIRGLENVAETIRRTTIGSTEEKLKFLRTFFGGLWHSWLFVLDDYQPKAFDGQPLHDILPLEGHGAILVVTCTPQVLDVAVELQVRKIQSEDENRMLCNEVCDALRDKHMDIVVDAIADGFDVNSRWFDPFGSDRGSIVELGARCDFAEAVQLFLDMGADPYPIKGHGSVLSDAAEAGALSTLKVYLDYEDKTSYPMDEGHYALAMSEAACNNHLETLKLLLKRRGDKIDRNHRLNRLEGAASSGYLDCLRLVFESNKVPESEENRGSIFGAAVKGQQVNVINFLLTDAKFDPNALDRDGCPALLHAVYRPERPEDAANKEAARREVISLLLAVGTLVNGKDRIWGETPLFKAARYGFASTVKLLLENGADPSIERTGGNMALEYCRTEGNEEVNQLLAGAKLSDPDAHKRYHSRLLRLAARVGDRVLAVQMSKEADIDAVHEKTGQTPLMAAIEKLQLPMARMLVRQGARQDIEDKEGRTPLRWAAELDLDLLIKDLVSAKDSPGLEAADKQGFTPLMIATKAGHIQTVSTLLALGADRDTMNDFGETALDIAEESRYQMLIAVLVS